jgi:gp16 family phage-associated protein
MSQHSELISSEALAQKRAELRLRGVNITTWAKQRQFSREMVYAVLHGRARAHRGQAHEIARSLGLIPGTEIFNITQQGGEISR